MDYPIDIHMPNIVSHYYLHNLFETFPTRSLEDTQKETSNTFKTEQLSSITTLLLPTEAWYHFQMFPEHLLLQIFQMQMV